MHFKVLLCNLRIHLMKVSFIMEIHLVRSLCKTYIERTKWCKLTYQKTTKHYKTNNHLKNLYYSFDNHNLLEFKTISIESLIDYWCELFLNWQWQLTPRCRFGSELDGRHHYPRQWSSKARCLNLFKPLFCNTWPPCKPTN